MRTRALAATSILTVTCTLLAVVASPVEAQPAQRVQAIQRPDAVEVPAAGIAVPMKFRNSMPAFDVMVNGEGPFFFALDTGGMGLARADVSLVEKLKLEKVGDIQASDGSGQGPTRTMDIVGLNEIRLGDAVFKGLTAASRDYNRGRAEHIDGILGIHLFQDHLLTLDYPGQELRLETGELPEADGETVLNLVPELGMPALEIEVAGEKILCHIDSGNMAGEIVLPTSLAEKLPLQGEPEVVGRARTVTNEIEIKAATLDGSVMIGGHEIKNPRVTFAEIFRTGNIGSGMLKHFAMTLDQKNGRVKFEKPTEE